MPSDKNRPLIGITACLLDRVEGQAHGKAAMHLTARYCKAVLDAGGAPVMLPTAGAYAAPPRDALRAVDGLLLSGGKNLSGSVFKKNPGLTLRETDPARWEYEISLARLAAQLDLPVLGICRGMQTMCEAWPEGRVDNLDGAGGKKDSHYQKADPETTTHGIITVADSILHGVLGPQARVNSFHRQVVGALPDGFVASAYSEDGSMEAMESKNGFMLGVQFHPEWLYPIDPAFLKIFKALIKHCRIRAGLDHLPGITE